MIYQQSSLNWWVDFFEMEFLTTQTVSDM